MMVNFQVKHQDKMVKGYITAETNSNVLCALFLYFSKKLFYIINTIFDLFYTELIRYLYDIRCSMQSNA